MKKTGPKKDTSALQAGNQRKTKTDGLPALSEGTARRHVNERGNHGVDPEMQNERLRRVQAELETFRRNFSDLYDFAPIGYFSFDKNGIILNVNLTGAIMLGMNKRLLPGKPFSRFIAHAAGREEFFKHLATVVKGQTKRTSELWLKGNDGVEFFAELQSIPAEGEQGATFVRATLADITERWRTEEALRESEEQFRSLFSQSPVAIELYDLDGRLIDANPSCLRIFGIRSIEEVKGFLLFEDPNVPADAKQRLRSGESVRFEAQFDFDIVIAKHLYETSRSGTCFIECYINRWNDASGNLRGYMVFVSEITERKQAEEALKESEQKFFLLFRKAGFGVILSTSPEGVFVDVNDAAERMFGYSRQEVIGKTSQDLDLYADPADRSRIFADFAERGVVRDHEVAMRVKSGEERIFLLNIIPLELGGLKHQIATIVDIADRKRAENALRERETQFRAFFDSPAVGMAQIDLNGRFLLVNETFCQITGYPREELLEMKVADLSYSDDRGHDNEVMFRILKGDLPIQSLEKRYLRKDGGLVWVNVSAALVRDAEGKPTYSTGIIQDITERKRAEEALKEQMQLVNLANDAIIIREYATDTITYWNEGAEHMYGWQRDEVVRKSTHVLLNTRFPGSLAEIKDALWTHGTWEGELYHTSREGTVICVLSRWTLQTEGGQPKSYIEINTDITNRKRTEEALQESRQRYSLLFSKSSVAASLLKWPDKVFVDVNEAFERLFGYARKEVIGRHPRELGIIRPDEDAAAMQAIELRGEQRGVEIHARTKTGEERTIIINHNTLEFEGERYVLSTMHDITDRKLAENLLMAATRELQERTHELAETNKELDAFSYSVSHDLRAPLRHIDGFVRALLDGYADKLDERGVDYLRRVGSGAQKMKDLVDALLGLSRYTRADLNSSQVYLSSMVQAAAEERRHGWPERTVELVVAEDVTAEGDPTMLQVVINNLVGNAWKFTRDRPDARIEFGVTEQSGEKVYFIRDNGVGFNKEYGERLFIPFQRLHTHEEFPGVGIGLATVQRIIHRHGGRIWAEGETGKGSTFYFTLG